MADAAAFDALAQQYDSAFSQSVTGREQRRVIRKWLSAILVNKSGLRILEINCGTGDDALWLAEMGHHVTATDASPAMIANARKKILPSNTKLPEFITASFEALHGVTGHQPFDLVFSNFAGLNCIPPHKLSLLGKQLTGLIKPGGHFAAVIFGKYCLWEILYFLSKASPRQAFRRWTRREVPVMLDAVTTQPVWFYSVKQFTRSFASLKRMEARPVGLCIPPSYLEGAMQKRRQFFRRLVKTEDWLNSPAIMRSLGDHTYMLFKKDTP